MNFSNIFNMFLNMFLSLLKTAFMLLIPILFLILAWIMIVILFYFYFRFFRQIKPRKVIVKPDPFPGFFLNVCYLFPKRLALDLLQRDRSEFMQYGIHLVIGEQGSGKSITVVYLLRKWQARWPQLKIYTNKFDYDLQDGELESWKDIIEYKNGKKGVVNVFDEMQTWFPATRQADSVPPELLGEICQQRKQRKAMLGTVQVFTRLAKPFREQVRYIYVPTTFLGCFTVVRITKPKYYDEKKNKFTKYCGTFVFAHTKELRNAYDTYKIIEKYKEAEFVSDSTILCGTSSEVPLMTETEVAAREGMER